MSRLEFSVIVATNVQHWTLRLCVVVEVNVVLEFEAVKEFDIVSERLGSTIKNQ